jgi:hypothetical protein
MVIAMEVIKNWAVAFNPFERPFKFTFVEEVEKAVAEQPLHIIAKRYLL